MVTLLLRFTDWLMNWLMPDRDEKPKRWILETEARAKALGISDDELDAMWKRALEEADPTAVGLAPFSLMRKYMDYWEAAHPKN